MALEFKDRVPQRPGRVKITPEDGTAFYATMERADEPIQEGTPLSAGKFNQMVAMIQNTYTKAETLTDATKAAYGLGANAVPEDVLAFLGEYAKYYWKRQTEDFVFSIGTAGTGKVSSEGSASATRKIYYGDSVAYTGNGNIVIVNEQSAEFSYNTREDFKTTVLGKYIRNVYTNTEQIYYIPTDASISASVSSGTYSYSIQRSVVSGGFQYGNNWEIVSSPDPNAYPEGSTDIEHGYYYIRVGRPFDHTVDPVKMVTGSYVGTGTYGSTKPNSLTFDFEPKMVAVYGSAGYNPRDGYWSGQILWLEGVKTQKIGTTSSSGLVNISQIVNTISWYNGEQASYQLNTSGSTYYYLAIG